jgi:hypothetical protein
MNAAADALPVRPPEALGRPADFRLGRGLRRGPRTRSQAHGRRADDPEGQQPGGEASAEAGVAEVT